jgi:enediyne biosynthesis protein E7
MRTMRDAPLDFLVDMTTTYGDIACHEVNGETVVVVNRPDLAAHVLRDNQANYTKSGTPDDLMLTPLLGTGLLTSEGDQWSRQRQMCAPPLRRRPVEAFDTIMTGAAHDLLERWRPAIDKGEPVRLDHDLTSVTLAVVVRSILGSDITGVGGRFGQAVDAVNRFIGHYVPGGTNDAATARELAQSEIGFREARTFLDRFVQTIIAARRVQSPNSEPDLLATMLAAHDGTNGVAMSDTELYDQVLTFIMAGHETTAKALTWTCYLLDRHPDAAQMVRGEIDGVLGGAVPTAAHLSRLPYTRSVIEEAMRLYPPVWLISRRAVDFDQVAGYDIMPGTLVCISPFTLHRHPEYWEEPEEFRPERFEPQRVALRPSHLYLPFGGGPRICIGRFFAMTEATLVLATLLQAVTLQLVPGFPVEMEALVTLRPRHGMVMIPRRR